MKTTKSKSVAGTTQDPNIQFADLTVDDQTFKLAYSFGTLAKAQSATGLPVLVGFKNVLTLQEVDPYQFLGLVYAALLVAQPHMTLDEAERLIRPDTFYDVWAALGNAYNLSIPKKKLAEQEPAKDQDDESK